MEESFTFLKHTSFLCSEYKPHQLASSRDRGHIPAGLIEGNDVSSPGLPGFYTCALAHDDVRYTFSKALKIPPGPRGGRVSHVSSFRLQFALRKNCFLLFGGGQRKAVEESRVARGPCFSVWQRGIPYLRAA